MSQILPTRLRRSKPHYGVIRMPTDDEVLTHVRPFWQAPLPTWNAIQRLQFVQLCVSIALFAQGIAIVSINKDFKIITQIPFVIWPAKDSTDQVFTFDSYEVGIFSFKFAIFAFFMIEALFELFSITVLFQWWSRALEVGFRAPYRYLGYAFSGSLMGVILLLLTGINDASFLWSTYTAWFVMMILGLIQERTVSKWKLQKIADESARVVIADTIDRLQGQNNEALVGLNPAETKLSAMLLLELFTPHLLGWTIFGAYFAVIVSKFIFSTGSAAPQKPPAWVILVFTLELLLFLAFGALQLVQQLIIVFTPITRGPDGKRLIQTHVIRIEYAFAFFNLVSKTLLAWLLYGEMIAESKISFQM